MVSFVRVDYRVVVVVSVVICGGDNDGARLYFVSMRVVVVVILW